MVAQRPFSYIITLSCGGISGNISIICSVCKLTVPSGIPQHGSPKWMVGEETWLNMSRVSFFLSLQLLSLQRERLIEVRRGLVMSAKGEMLCRTMRTPTRSVGGLRFRKVSVRY